ncbi:MAG TPA: hypothetical protein VGN17_28725 [Bryobacteraceae bacterium]
MCALPLLAAQSAEEILQRNFAAKKANNEKARQYTSLEEDTRCTYDKSGQSKQTSSETYEVMFLEGEQYKKLVARSGQPLNTAEQAKEEKKLQEEAKARRKKRGSGLFTRTFSIGSADDAMLFTHFENRIVGEEEVNGRRAWVIESVPKADRKPANDHERDVLSTRQKRWVDQADYNEARWQAVVVGDKSPLKPGTTFTIEFAKINDDAWLGTFLSIDFRMEMMKFIKGAGRQESRFSKFQKFDVQSTITVDAGTAGGK